MIWKIWKKSKLNGENIWNMWKKSSWIVKYGNYEKISWIVKRYGKYGRKPSWIVKRYGKYGRNPRLNSEKIWKMEEK